MATGSKLCAISADQTVRRETNVSSGTDQGSAVLCLMSDMSVGVVMRLAISHARMRSACTSVATPPFLLPCPCP